MGEVNRTTTPDDGSILAKKSWTAYLAPTVALALFLAVIAPMVWSLNNVVGVVVVVGASALYVYILLMMRSYRLYFNDAGVWVFSGVFPWNKGSNGVKWRDIDEAVYFTGLFSWLFHSYTVRIGHRFTKAGEIVLTHMQNGNTAVEKINEAHQSRVSKE